MIHIKYQGQLLEARLPETWPGTPSVGEVYVFNDLPYTIASVVMDCRKDYLEVSVEPDFDTQW